MPGKKIESIDPTTVRQVHEALLNSKSISEASSTLNIPYTHKLFSDFILILRIKVSEQFTIPKKIGKDFITEHLPNQAAFENYFGMGFYDGPYELFLQTIKNKLKDITIDMLHAALQQFPVMSNHRLALTLRTHDNIKHLVLKLGLTYDEDRHIDKTNHPLGSNTETAKTFYKEWYDKPILDYLKHIEVKYSQPQTKAQPQHKQQSQRTNLSEAEISAAKRTTPHLTETNHSMFHTKRKKPENVFEPPLKSMKPAATPSDDEINTAWLDDPAILEELSNFFSTSNSVKTISSENIDPIEVISKDPTLPNSRKLYGGNNLFEKNALPNQANDELIIPSPHINMRKKSL